MSRDAWKRRFKKAHGEWPSFVSDSDVTAEKEWFNLSEEEREEAATALAAYVASYRKSGRTKFCAFAVYLREKRWTKLPKGAVRALGGGDMGVAAPFGKAWSALRFADLMRAPYGRQPRLTASEERLCVAGQYDRAELMRSKQAKTGWPKVTEMQVAATRFHKGASADEQAARLGEICVQVGKGTDLWRAWKALHEERGWPWLGEDRDCPDWVYFPAPPDVDGDWPSLLEAVRAAVERFRQMHETQQTTQEAAQ